MTDWLEEILDRDTGETVPEGFASRVVARTQTQGRLLRFPRVAAVAAAAVLLLAAGFWMGNGAKPMEPVLIDPGSTNSASLELAELYSNRDVLQDFEILSDADLEFAFIDESTGAWILDETVEANMPASDSAETDGEPK
ncbi:MAG: hypothetical protein GY747_00955 [Planctomycetes bacterium]|nr:hypothetical protein [Planctomycetota bacterium]MCP4769796.1 hypothetical protein [Planctomycetota bacterium]MCP4859636.1 hypothetical protein [Planctomycetota bacterium]